MFYQLIQMKIIDLYQNKTISAVYVFIYDNLILYESIIYCLQLMFIPTVNVHRYTETI